MILTNGGLNINSKERTLSAIKGIPEDKIPFNPFVMHLAAGLTSVDYSKEYCQKPEVLVEGQLKLVELFDIDHVHVATDAYREANAWGVDVHYESHTPAPISGTELRIEEFDTVETPNLLESQRIQDRVKAVEMLSEKVGDKLCVVGWIEAPLSELCYMFSMEKIMELGGHTQPKWEKTMKKLAERILPVQVEFAQLQIEAGADIIGVGDASVSQIGPKNYETSTLKVTQKLHRTIEKQVPALYHTCGDNSKSDMLELIAVAAGASVLDIDFQVDLAQAKEQVGSKVCLRGNTSTTVLGTPCPPEEVINQVTRSIEAGKSNGMYMYAAGCEWPWKPLDIAIRNLSIAKTLIEKLGRYN